MPADLNALEGLFLGLADKTRLRLLALMAAGPVSVGHLVAETRDSQPKISRHLAYLRNAGLVDTTREGKWIYYGVAALADETADSIFRGVIDELSGRSSQGEELASRRPHIAQREFVTSGQEYGSDEYRAQESDTEQDTDRTHPSEERRDELEIFML